MKIFSNRNIKQFFLAIGAVLTAFFALAEVFVWVMYQKFSLILLFGFLLMAFAVLAVCFLYFRRQNKTIEAAVSRIEEYLDGDMNARIDCDEEGELYCFFHEVNTLAAVLNAHAANELREKEFLKNTISDISHQLKTPLAALNIYNGLLQGETEEFLATQDDGADCSARAAFAEMKEFAVLSEQELDRIEILVQNLLKITRLDAGSVVFEKREEDLYDMMKDIELHFSYRAKQEKKDLVVEGEKELLLSCDRNWMTEAISNVVKNAFDHTKEGDEIRVTWRRAASVIQITIKDSGCGIHPEDLHHIFKRFYRSRFSKDTQGIGLGLPLAEAIIEGHDGTIEVESEEQKGTVFVISFLIPTKL